MKSCVGYSKFIDKNKWLKQNLSTLIFIHLYKQKHKKQNDQTKIKFLQPNNTCDRKSKEKNVTNGVCFVKIILNN